MKLEQQVSSLDLAKRLKELGVKQESLFYWVDKHQGGWQLLNCHGSHMREECSAFTVAELGEMLPASIDEKGEVAFLHFEKTPLDGQWAIAYKVGQDWLYAFCWFDTEADARTKMLIYLLENKIINAQNE